MNLYKLGWRAAPGKKARDLSLKLFMLGALCTFFLSLFYSSGINYFFSKNWRATVFLKEGVTDEKGQIFAERINRLDFVAKSSFHTSQDLWKEFEKNLKDADRVKEFIGERLPGYIDISFKQSDINERNVKKLVTVANNEESTAEVLYGGNNFYRMLRIKLYVNLSLILTFIFFLFLITLLFYFIDGAFLLFLSKEVEFVREHLGQKKSGGPSMIAGNLIEGILSGCASLLLAFLLMKFLFNITPGVVKYISFPPLTNPSTFAGPSIAVLIFSGSCYLATGYAAHRNTGSILTGER